MIEDELLKWKFKSGSKDALQRIYEKYRDDLVTLTMMLINNAGLAEDIVQDVFVVFAQSSDTFRLRGCLRSYLTTCTVNRCRDQIRARKHQPLSLDEEFIIMASGIWSEGARLNTEFELICEDGGIAATAYSVQMLIDSVSGEPCLTTPEILERCRSRWKAGEFDWLK